MASEVFGYFVSIGAGLMIGLTIGAAPAVLIWKWMKRKEGGRHGYSQTAKARS